ncbi:MAG: DUF1772 domain-containing protein [Acidobacteriaceae bacterium]
MTLFLNLATTLCVGLMIGVELAVSAFINPILEKLDDRTRLTAIRLFAARLGAAMPVWYALSFVLLLAEAILLRHQPQFLLLALAVGIWAAVIILTLLFLVPINNKMTRLDSDAPPASALKEHAAWDAMHRLRVAALTAAMALFLVAIHV